MANKHNNMKQLIFSLFLFISTSTIAQTEIDKQDPLSVEILSLKSNVSNLEKENVDLKATIATLDTKLSNVLKRIDSLEGKTDQNSSAISQTAEALGIKISTTEANTTQKFTEVDKSLSSNSLLGVIAVLLAIIVSGLLYWLLNKQQKTNKIEVLDQISKTKESLEEGLIKEFGKQTSLIEDGLKMLSQQRTEQAVISNSEPDHSLALKLASEINLIERNVKLMDAKTKGLKQLQASIKKLKDNLSANGYDMPELLGKKFHEGMKVIVFSSIADETLEKGAEIISKILIPQVNYNDKMIQTAQIEVSVGY